jgi:hypothetical protein
MDPNLKVSLSTITNPLSRYSKRVTTNHEKRALYEIVEAVGTEITRQTPGFDTGEFTKACGVNPEWATAAA